MPIRRPPSVTPGEPAPEHMSENLVADVGSMSLPDAWQKLGVTREFSPVPLNRTRMFMVGDVKTGKTTLLLGRDKTLLLDLENGACNVPKAKAYRRYIGRYQELVDVMNQLKSDARRNARVFEHVVIDSIDRLQALCCDKLREEYDMAEGKSFTDYGGGKRGYSILAERVLSFPRELYLQGYGWTCVGHLKWAMMKDEDGDDYEGQRASVTPAISGGLVQDADLLCVLHREIKKKEVEVPSLTGKGTTKKIEYIEQYVLGTKNRNARDLSLDLGTRVDLPERLTIPASEGWSVVEAAYRDAIEAKRLAAEKAG